MVVYTMTKKQLLKIISIVLFCVIALTIAVFAVFNAVTASAEAVKRLFTALSAETTKLL